MIGVGPAGAGGMEQGALGPQECKSPGGGRRVGGAKYVKRRAGAGRGKLLASLHGSNTATGMGAPFGGLSGGGGCKCSLQSAPSLLSPPSALPKPLALQLRMSNNKSSLSPILRPQTVKRRRRYLQREVVRCLGDALQALVERKPLDGLQWLVTHFSELCGEDKARLDEHLATLELQRERARLQRQVEALEKDKTEKEERLAHLRVEKRAQEKRQSAEAAAMEGAKARVSPPVGQVGVHVCLREPRFGARYTPFIDKGAAASDVAVHVCGSASTFRSRYVPVPALALEQAKRRASGEEGPGGRSLRAAPAATTAS